jgi:hypothetical protein
MPDLRTLATGATSVAERRFSAIVSRAPTDFGEPLEVVVPGFTEQLAYEVEKWTPASAVLPAVGDEALIEIADDETVWMTAYMPASYDFGSLDNNYHATASGTLTVTATTSGARQNIPGATLTLATAGRYKVSAVYDVEKTAHAGIEVFVGVLDVAGTAQADLAAFKAAAAGHRATVAQQWKVTVVAGTVVKLSAWKAAATTGTYVVNVQTTIEAEQLSD